MAKLKYDRVINISLTGKNVATIPKDEVWKVSIGPGYGGPRANLYGGGVQFRSGFRDLAAVCIRYRLQTHRRVSDSMEVILHG